MEGPGSMGHLCVTHTGTAPSVSHKKVHAACGSCLKGPIEGSSTLNPLVHVTAVGLPGHRLDKCLSGHGRQG
jgi:hypothetical protein